MLEKEFERLYLKLRADFYQRLFARVKEHEGSLSATEAFCAEVIFLLKRPSIGEFANFINISQSNATYKINSLIAKGYIKKTPSSRDKREYRLEVTSKFLDYYGLSSSYIRDIMTKIREDLSEEEAESLESAIKKILNELEK